MRVDNISKTSFKAKLILAEKNNALIKKAIRSSFNQEYLKYKLDEIYEYQPKTELLVEMESLDESQCGETHEIIITNQNNAQSVKIGWCEKGLSSWNFAKLIDDLTNLENNIINNFWNASPIKKKTQFNILQHKIFADEYDFNSEKHLKELEQEDTIKKLSTKLDKIKSDLNDIVREYKFDKNPQLKLEHSKPRFNCSDSSFRDCDKNFWKDIDRVKEYPNNKLSKETDVNNAIWASTMIRNCNK